MYFDTFSARNWVSSDILSDFNLKQEFEKHAIKLNKCIDNYQQLKL